MCLLPPLLTLVCFSSSSRLKMSRKMEEPRRVMIFQEHNVSEPAYVWPRVFLNFQKRLRLVFVDVMTLLIYWKITSGVLT